MDWLDVVIFSAGVAMVGWLLHAANLLGHNPYLRIKQHEDLSVGACRRTCRWKKNRCFWTEEGWHRVALGAPCFSWLSLCLPSWSCFGHGDNAQFDPEPDQPYAAGR